MKNTNKYIAPVVELFSISTKEDCMLQASGESTGGNVIVDFGDLL